MGGQHHVTVVLKASFSYTEQGEIEPITEPEAVQREAGWAPAPMVSASSDLAPFLGRAEIWLSGNACAPGIREVESVAARLAVGRHELLVDKTVHVYGDRVKGQGTAPRPFKKIPLLYERAVGGPLNPAAPPNRPPNIVDPEDAARPIGLGLLARTWPIRRDRLAGATPPEDQPRLELPPDFDWAYFQAVPDDQQCTRILGDEWVVLDGLHPMRPRVQLRLPGACAFAQVLAPGLVEQGHAIALSCDGLHIDTARQRFTLRWRGAFPVVEPARLGELCVEGALSISGAPVDWSSLRAERPSGVPPAASGRQRATRAEAPAAHGRGRAAEAGSRRSAPALPASARGTLAVGTGSTEVREQLGLPPAGGQGAQPGRARSASQPRFRAFASRLAVSQTDAELLREVLGIGSASAVAAAGGEDEPSSTASLSDDEAVALRQKLAIPFPQAAAGQRVAPLRLLPFPGAPWERLGELGPPSALAGAQPRLAPLAPPPTVPGFRAAPGSAELLARNRARPRPAGKRPAVGARTRVGSGVEAGGDHGGEGER